MQVGVKWIVLSVLAMSASAQAPIVSLWHARPGMCMAEDIQGNSRANRHAPNAAAHYEIDSNFSDDFSDLYAQLAGLNDHYPAASAIPGGDTVLEPGMQANGLGRYGQTDNYDGSGYGVMAFYGVSGLKGSYAGRGSSDEMGANGSAYTDERQNGTDSDSVSSGAIALSDTITQSDTNDASEDGQHTYPYVSAPEPSTFALLGIGLFGLNLARRKRGS